MLVASGQGLIDVRMPSHRAEPAASQGESISPAR
jgi:hypothetical protein